MPLGSRMRHIDTRQRRRDAMLMAQFYGGERGLGDLGNSLLRIVAHESPDTATIAAVRWQIAQALRGSESGSSFRRYIADWPVDRIGRQWEGFGAATRAMLASLPEAA
jgi:hypothetical protein